MRIAVLFATCLLAACFSNAYAGFYTVSNVEVQGPPSGLPVAGMTAEACQEKCEANENCGAFMFIHETSMCVEKSHVPRLVHLPEGQTSIVGLKNANPVCPTPSYTSYVGEDSLDHDYMSAVPVTEDECQGLCTNQDSCLGFVYATNLKKCWIKVHLQSNFTQLPEGQVGGLKVKNCDPPAATPSRTVPASYTVGVSKLSCLVDSCALPTTVRTKAAMDEYILANSACDTCLDKYAACRSHCAGTKQRCNWEPVGSNFVCSA